MPASGPEQISILASNVAQQMIHSPKEEKAGYVPLHPCTKTSLQSAGSSMSGHMLLQHVSSICFLFFQIMFFKRALSAFLQDVSWAYFLGTFLETKEATVSWPSCFTQHVSWTQMRVSSLQKQQRGQHRHTEASSRKYCREKSLGLPQKYQRWHSENTKERHPKGKTPPWVKHNKQDRHQKAPERKHNKNRYPLRKRQREKEHKKQSPEVPTQHKNTGERADNTEKYREANTTEKGRSAPCPGASKIKAASHKKSICHRFQHAKLNNVGKSGPC